jgi:hypothetical protein
VSAFGLPEWREVDVPFQLRPCRICSVVPQMWMRPHALAGWWVRFSTVCACSDRRAEEDARDMTRLCREVFAQIIHEEYGLKATLSMAAYSQPAVRHAA